MIVTAHLVVCSLGLLAAVLILSSGSVDGAEDAVKIGASIPGAPATDVVYKGEISVMLSITNGQNCSNWSVELSNPLFITHLRGIARERMVEGKKVSYSLEINPDADIGTYSFTVFINYSTDDGHQASTEHDFTIHHRRSYEVVTVDAPHGADHTFALSVEFFQQFKNFTVMFDGEGGIGIEDEIIVLENPDIGVVTISTTVFQNRSEYSSQLVSYYCIGVVDNRTIEVWEYNIPVSVTWGDDEPEDPDEPTWQPPIALIALLCLVLIVFNVYWFWLRRRTT
jgi:hypothetical protein